MPCRNSAACERALPGVPIVVIAGNHDTPRSTDTTSIFGLLSELGSVHVADADARRIVVPELDLSIFAVPHQALFETPRIVLEPAGPEKHQVLVIHGEVPGLFGDDHSIAEPGGAMLSDEDLRGNWSYVALGPLPRAAQGARPAVVLRFARLRLDQSVGRTARRARFAHQRQGVAARRSRHAADRAAARSRRRAVFSTCPGSTRPTWRRPKLDRLIAERRREVPGGIGDAVVRQVVRNVAAPRRPRARSRADPRLEGRSAPFPARPAAS